MGNAVFVRRTHVEAPSEEVFRWHERPGAMERLTPPWVRLKVLGRRGGLENGARVKCRVRLGPLWFPWELEHCDYIPGLQFCDAQKRGPFAFWEHIHRFDADGEATCLMQDRVNYELPLGRLGTRLADARVRRELERLFFYRHRVIKHDVLTHRARAGASPLRILISGSSGLIGSALAPFLTAGGHTVIRLVRGGITGGEGTACWDPAMGWIEAGRLGKVDAVIHLAGETLNGLRWTRRKKERILGSRVMGTRLLADTLARLPDPPKALLSASAIGFYGHRGGEVLHEESRVGSGFLSDVCRQWEEATEPAEKAGLRVAHLRFGLVLSPAGGVLAKMLCPFRLCVGGPLGSGWQYMSWIAVDDAVNAIHHVLMSPEIRGPVNVTAPYAVTNRDFAKALGAVLGKPCLFRVPETLLSLAMGEVADSTILASARVEPRKLLDSGFVFHYPEIEGALRHVLGCM